MQRLRRHCLTIFAALVLLSQAHAVERPAQCLIEPAARVSLRSAVSAQIVAVLVDRGSVVRKGQVLVSLDSSVERATAAASHYRAAMEGQIKSAEAKVVHGESRLQRREDLHTEHYISTQDRDDAAADLRVAQGDLLEARDNRALARLDGLRLDAEIGRRQLLSPIDGIVTERLQNPGELAQSGDGGVAILKLVQVDPARVEIVLPAAQHGRLKVGDIVSVKAEPPFNGVYKATVKVVDSVIDSASGTFGVRMEVANPKHDVPIGVKCAVDLS